MNTNEETERCESYVGVSCVDGSCPMANAEEFMERGYDIVHNCSECGYYHGCEDCAFNGMSECCEQKYSVVCKE